MGIILSTTTTILFFFRCVKNPRGGREAAEITNSPLRCKIRAVLSVSLMVKSVFLVTLLHAIVGFQLIILPIKRGTLDSNGLYAFVCVVYKTGFLLEGSDASLS